MNPIRFLLLPTIILSLALCSAGIQEAPTIRDYTVYVGTYTGVKSRGIYAYRLNPASGELSSISLAANTDNPSFLALHPNGRYLYAVNEVSEFEGKAAGSVSAFARNSTGGGLSPLNRVSSGGRGPCYLTVDPTGKNVLVANYGGGSVAAIPIDENGRLREASSFIQHTGSSVNPKRQAAPHAHYIGVSPDSRFVLAADLGLDKILVYLFDPSRGALAANNPPFAMLKPGAGPRHLAFHPNGRFAYVINELQSTVTAFAWGVNGTLEELQTVSTLPEDYAGNNSTAEIKVHPSGRFLYGSNRGHDSIAVFAIDPRAGTLSPVETISSGGRTPRNFGIDPSGSHLVAANQASDNLTVFRIDPKTGRLTAAGKPVEAFTPVCVVFSEAR